MTLWAVGLFDLWGPAVDPKKIRHTFICGFEIQIKHIPHTEEMLFVAEINLSFLFSSLLI